MNNSRRKFLRNSGCGLSAAALMSSFAKMESVASAAAAPQTADYKALVCIFLYGGNDANNMVIPFSNYAAYNAVRGTSSGINIPQANLQPVNAPSHSAMFGLHPNMPELQALYNQQKLAVLCNVGTLVRPLTKTEYQSGAPRPFNLFSHFDQQEQWQSSLSQGPGNGPSGWGGRTADQTNTLNGTSLFPMEISLAGQIMFMNGTTQRPLVPGSGSAGNALAGFSDSVINQARYKALRNILNQDNNLTLVGANNALTRTGIDNINLLNQALNGVTLTTPFPGTGLGNQLRQIAQIIKARASLGLQRQIFFASMGGFDTHNGQLSAHVNLYTELSQGMKAFYDATVELGVANGVTSFTLSDFGRTFQPAAGAGTDHAWGSHHFIMGGAVRGGDFYGRFPTLQLSGPDDSNAEGRWIPTTSVDQYGATLAQWFGLPVSAVPNVFPNIGNFASRNLGFVV